jgi:signal transduction histidine kinase
VTGATLSALRALAAEQAALRRVASLVASGAESAQIFRVVSEEAGLLVGAQSASIVRYDAQAGTTVIGYWDAAQASGAEVGAAVSSDEETPPAGVFRPGRAAQVDSCQDAPGEVEEFTRGDGSRSVLAAPVEVDGSTYGAIIVVAAGTEQFPCESEKRLNDFAELVGFAVANAEAREQLARSRARIVEAADAERRRLERNLHDGAQSRLIAVLLSLRVLEKKIETGAEGIDQLAREATEQLTIALAELRELARGLHPAVLTDRGLGPALEMLASRSAVPVDLAPLPAGRLPQPVEAAAYYVVAEALTNVAKYAGASSARVEVQWSHGRASVEVSDDGCGGADPQNGSGIRGLADRIEALGGWLEFASDRGMGTTVRAHIPY